MKKRILALSLLALVGVTGCNKEEPTPKVEISNELTTELLESLQGSVELEGVANIKYGKADNITDITVSYTDSSYYYNGYDTVNKSYNIGQIYKMGGVPTLVLVNNKNEYIYKERKDNKGNIESWDTYANPFKGLSVFDFVKDETKDGLYHYLTYTDTQKNFVISLCKSLTAYTVPEFEDFTIQVIDGQVNRISFVSTVEASAFGDSQFFADFGVKAIGNEVKPKAFPDKFEHKPEHDKSAAALKKLNTVPVSGVTTVKETYTGKWEDATDSPYKFAYTDSYCLVTDESYQDGSGYVVVDGEAYEVKYEVGKDGAATYTKKFFATKDKDGNAITTLAGYRGDIEYLVAELFEVRDDKHFVYEGDYTKYASYYYSLTSNPYAQQCRHIEITLNDNYDIEEIYMTDDEYYKVNVKIEKYGDAVTAPWAEAGLINEEDPRLKFVGTFTGKVDEATTVKVVVTSDHKITLDGKEATDVTYNQRNDKFTFKVDNIEYDLKQNWKGVYQLYNKSNFKTTDLTKE